MRALAVFLIATSLMAPAAAAAPNIIYVMVDDMGPADAGCFGGTHIRTPHLDRMAKEGLLVSNHYSGCTVCAPCRSVLMTGKHMGRTSVRLNTGGVPLLDADVTVAEVLRKAGYATGGFGKWGIGDIGTEGVPEKQGFDEFYGYYHQIHAHKHYPDFLVRNGVKEPIKNSKPDTKLGYAPDMIFGEMKKFIRRAAEDGKPFFAYGPWTPPHGGYNFPHEDPIWDHYKDREGWSGTVKGHAAMTTLVDRHMGELLDLLDELGIAGNTVVFFHSDNGSALTGKQNETIRSSGPLRGQKRSPYEGGVRAPLLVRWKGTIAPARNDVLIASAQDALPTLAELAGATQFVPKDVTGRSYVAAFSGKHPPNWHDYHYWEWGKWDWKRNREVPGGTMQGLRKDNWKIARARNDQPWELYDLAADPGEKRNLAENYPRKVMRLEALVKQARVPMRPQREPEHPEGQRFN
ncbi:MAG: sulfatase-like hydrolase/transferase [Akkermansiaceae bacterium]|nr:sulfatase-like hydrolase/transferase [Akkermansiaceae bacterium]NNM29886.1 sulfatase-like hydrolase/transferase [Akkermansiaceae bacterium]